MGVLSVCSKKNKEKINASIKQADRKDKTRERKYYSDKHGSQKIKMVLKNIKATRIQTTMFLSLFYFSSTPRFWKIRHGEKASKPLLILIDKKTKQTVQAY